MGPSLNGALNGISGAGVPTPVGGVVSVPAGADPTVTTTTTTTTTTVMPVAVQAQPVGAQLQGVKARLNDLLATSMTRGAMGTQGQLTEMLNKSLPRPAQTLAGYAEHPQLVNAMQQCEAAMVELGKVPAGNFVNPATSERADTVLKAYTTAMYELCRQLKDYDTATNGQYKREVEALYNGAQFRIGEALNAVGAILRRQSDASAAPVAQESVPELMAEVSGTMHGGQLLKGLEKKASKLFAEMDELGQQQGKVPLAKFQSQAKALAKRAEQLKSQAMGLKDAKVPGVKTMTLAFDRTLRDSLVANLDRATGRLMGLAKHDPKEEVRKALDELLVKVNSHQLDFLENSENAALRHLAANYREQTEIYNRGAEDLKAQVAKGKLKGRAMVDCALQLVRNYQFSGASAHISELFASIQTLQKGNPEKTAFCAALTEKLIMCGVDNLEADDTAAFLYNQLKNDAFKTATAEANGNIGNPLAEVSSQLIRAQFEPVRAMLDGIAAKRPDYNGRLVNALFDHSMNLQTLVGAALLRLPEDQLELRAGDEALVASRKLGQGAANTVTLCTYRGRDGEDERFVFKPELGARLGMAGLAASDVGYKDEVRIMQLNLASTVAANAIGCGQSIAQSKIGTHEGRLGLMMEHAPGKTAGEIGRGTTPIATSADGREMTLNSVRARLNARDLLLKAQANLMRELNNLEWADILSGQVDRHRENYLVDINPDTGAVKVTGIDNDASFGYRKVGMQKISIAGLEKLLPKWFPVEYIDAEGILDTSRLDEDQLTFIQDLFGLNQLFAPTHINRATYDRLIAIQPDEYLETMKQYMDDEAAQAAKRRLEDAQTHARSLEQAGRVVDDWENLQVISEMERISASFTGENGQFLRRGFFMRDFYGIF